VNLYTISLFVHLLGLIAMFGGFVLLQNAGRRLRAATTWQEARPWLDLLRPLAGMLAGGGVMVLASGLYMTRVQWSFEAPWIAIGMAVAVLFMIVGPLIAGRKLAAVRRAALNDEGSLSEEGRARIADPLLWSTLFTMNGLALAMLWLMTTKPGWGQSILVPLVLGVIGWVAGTRVVRRRARAPRSERLHGAHAPPLAGRPRPG
jgi:hypothetical protein